MSITGSSFSGPDSTTGDDSSLCPQSDSMVRWEGNVNCIDVHNFFLLKHIKDDPDIEKGLFLVGTFVQHINGWNKQFREAFDEKDRKFFRYRFNDEEAHGDNGMVQFRKTEEDRQIITSTLSVKAPLDMECHVELFPFVIMKASLEVELCTLSTKGNKERLRPSLCLNKLQKSGNISIQPPKSVLRRKKGLPNWLCKLQHKIDDSKSSTKNIIQKLDKSEIYDFISPFPEVTYIVKDGNDCSKFQISFYLKESTKSKFVRFVLPIVLVSTMNAFHVLTNEYTDHSDYLANSAAFALTIVFLLASICPTYREESTYSLNTLYIFLIFFGLLLSSIPAGIFKYDPRKERIEQNSSSFPSAWPSHIGAMVCFSSLLVPIHSYCAYRIFRWKLKNELDKNKDYFIEEKNTPQQENTAKFDSHKHKWEDYFLSICDLVKNEEDLKKVGYMSISDKAKSMKGITCLGSD